MPLQCTALRLEWSVRREVQRGREGCSVRRAVIQHSSYTSPFGSTQTKGMSAQRARERQTMLLQSCSHLGSQGRVKAGHLSKGALPWQRSPTSSVGTADVRGIAGGGVWGGRPHLVASRSLREMLPSRGWAGSKVLGRSYFMAPCCKGNRAVGQFGASPIFTFACTPAVVQRGLQWALCWGGTRLPGCPSGTATPAPNGFEGDGAPLGLQFFRELCSYWLRMLKVPEWVTVTVYIWTFETPLDAFLKFSPLATN